MLDYELEALLEENDTKKIREVLENTSLEELKYNYQFNINYPLAILAVKFNSVLLWEYLKNNLYDMNEEDEFGLTTYNYLQLYWNKETIDIFLDGSIKEDHNHDKAFEHLKIAKQNIKDLNTNEDLFKAHKYTFNNYKMLFAKQECVCIYCKERFSSNNIIDYSMSEEGTALCPFCGIDSVVGECSGYKLDENFIESMHKKFFID